jgi:FrmR/RcnR family transcriptional regulator, repressor of frmRAB operon
MAHTVKEKKKLINRVRRIRGQVESLEKALEEEKEYSLILQTIAACRGAINGFMFEILEGHILTHVLDPDIPITSDQSKAAQELIDLVRTYLK